VSTGDTTEGGQGAARGANSRAVPAAGVGDVPLVQGPQITRLDGRQAGRRPRPPGSKTLFSVSLVQRSHTQTQLITLSEEKKEKKYFNGDENHTTTLSADEMT
jgi:hypothetical protein